MKTTTRHQDSESCHQSLEHELLEVVVEDGVLHVSEHQADVPLTPRHAKPRAPQSLNFRLHFRDWGVSTGRVEHFFKSIG